MKPRSKFIIRLIVLVMIFLVSFQSVQVNAQTLRAGERGPIQTLIDNATDGGTVIIPAGTYSETLTIDKNLTLTGGSNLDTILHPAGSGQRVITVTAGHNLVVNYLYIQNGQAPGNGGGGIYMAGGNLTVDHSFFNNNSADYGGAIFMEANTSTVTINNSYLIANTATADGGAVFARGNATLYLAYFGNNSAGSHGGGIHVQDGSLTTWGGQFIDNVAGGNGGGANVNNNVSISLTYFTTNTSGNQGGGLLQWNSDKTVTIASATFTGNTAELNGGGAYLTSHATISYNKFISNTANSSGTSDTYGGGLYASNGADVTYSKFIDNRVICSGCALRLGGAVFTSGVFNGTNLLFARNVASYGSALYFSNSTGWLNHVTIGQPTRANNSAILVNSGSNLTMYNSIISSYPTGVYISGTLYEGNNILFNNGTNFFVNLGVHNAYGSTLLNIDPLFMDPATDDYHLRAFSPAIGAGTDTPIVVLYDLDVKSRTNRWDIGAYQFWTSFYLPLLIR